MKKRYFLICIMVMLALLLLTSCNGGQTGKSPRRIEVVPGSFKLNYRIDEELDLSEAYINVVYWDGDSARVAITQSMVSDFDSRKTLAQGYMTIKYGSVETKIIYSVGNNETAIDTHMRLLMRQEGSYIIFSLRNIDDYEIIAATFSLICSDYDIFETYTPIAKNSAVNYDKKTEGIKILWYNAKAEGISQDTDILKIKLKDAYSQTIETRRIEVSDGNTIIRLPSKVILLQGEEE